MEKTRHFIVDTPVGQLAIYAKHDKTDCAADYPGVFIDYVRKDGATAILACVEYDPNKEALQTVVYGNCAWEMIWKRWSAYEDFCNSR